jgi:hypothetical protein
MDSVVNRVVISFADGRQIATDNPDTCAEVARLVVRREQERRAAGSAQPNQGKKSCGS